MHRLTILQPNCLTTGCTNCLIDWPSHNKKHSTILFAAGVSTVTCSILHPYRSSNPSVHPKKVSATVLHPSEMAFYSSFFPVRLWKSLTFKPIGDGQGTLLIVWQSINLTGVSLKTVSVASRWFICNKLFSTNLKKSWKMRGPSKKL